MTAIASLENCIIDEAQSMLRKAIRVHTADRFEFGVSSSAIGSMGSLVSTLVTPSALSEFSASVSVASSTSDSLKNTETSYVGAASDRRLDAAVAMHAPSELESLYNSPSTRCLRQRL